MKALFFRVLRVVRSLKSRISPSPVQNSVRQFDMKNPLAIRPKTIGLLVIAAVFLIETKGVIAQQSDGQGQFRVFPWRVNAPANPSEAVNQVPRPPVVSTSTNPLRLLNGSNNQQQEPAAGGTQQPVISKFTDQVPGAPSGASAGPIENNPPLSVPSNAKDEDDSEYCNTPIRNYCCLGDVQRLIPCLPGGITAGGFSQFGYHNRDTVTFNNRRGTVNPHQNWLYLDRAANGGNGRTWGFRVDGVYGIDAPDIQAIGNPPTGAPTGWDNSWDHGAYGFALPQAYVEYDNVLTNVKIGKFLSPIGFEAVPSVENFFYSRTYARYYTEPFSHTGILAQREMRPGVTGIGGVTLGWNSAFDNTDNGFNLITGVRMNPSDRVSLGLTGSLGDTGYRGSGVLQTATAQIRLTDRLTWGFQGDYLNLQTNDEIGATNYLFFSQSQCLAFGARLEWWKSDQLFASSQSTWDWTVGVNWRPHANVVIRPELRTDWGAATDNDWEPIIGIDAIVLF